MRSSWVALTWCLLAGCPSDGDQADAACESCDAQPAHGTYRISGRADGVDATIAVSTPDGVVCTRTPATTCELAAGQTLTFRAPLVEGHRFVGWVGEGCASNDASLSLVAQTDLACTARYVRRVTVAGAVEVGGVRVTSAAPFASCNDTQCIVDAGSEVVLEAPRREGYRLFAWAGCDGGTRRGYTLTLAANDDATCSAAYSSSLTVRALVVGADAPLRVSSRAEDAECDAGMCSVSPGESVDLSAPELTGFRFLGWSGDPSCTGSEYAITTAQLTASITCTASYVARFAVRGSSEGCEPAARISASSADMTARCADETCQVDRGSSVVLIADSVPGYRLSSWSGDGCAARTTGASTILSNVSRDFDCVAQYARGVSVSGTLRNFDGEVTANSTDSNGDCDNGSCAIPVGASVTLTAPLDLNRTFLGWTGDEGCSGTSVQITLENVQVSKSCIATYAPQVRVAAIGTPAAFGSVTASASGKLCQPSGCTVDRGAQVTLEAKPIEDARFVGWTGGGPCTGSTPRLVLTADADITCSASFVGRVDVATSVMPAGAGTVSASSDSTQASCSAGHCTVDAGSNVQLRVEPTPGYRFVGWSGCASGDSNPLTLGVNTATQCVASFENVGALVFQVSVESADGIAVALMADDGATCSGTSCSVNVGGAVRLLAWSPDGVARLFTGWASCDAPLPTQVPGRTDLAFSATLSGIERAQRCVATSEPYARVRATQAVEACDKLQWCTGSASETTCAVPISANVMLNPLAPMGQVFDHWHCADVGSGGELNASDLSAPFITLSGLRAGQQRACQALFH
jgi:hypothetical protein